MTRPIYVTDDEGYDIYDMDHKYMDAEKTDGEYCIGLAGYIKNQREPILLSAISRHAFLQHNASEVLRYLIEYSTSSVVSNPEVHILRVSVDNRQTYNVTFKTGGIRMLQRRWRNLFRQGH